MTLKLQPQESHQTAEANPLLSSLLGSFPPDSTELDAPPMRDDYAWLAEFIRFAKSPPCIGFQWACVPPGVSGVIRILGIQALTHDPQLSITRFETHGHVLLETRAVDKVSNEVGLDRYLIIEPVSGREVILRDCALVSPSRWYILREYVLGKFADRVEERQGQYSH